MELKMIKIEGHAVHYRPGTSDERVLKEVLGGVYRRKRDGFDVQPGEKWLDLGANIGAFALYCALRGATAECFEPEPECYRVLYKNLKPLGFRSHHAAYTHWPEKRIAFAVSPHGDDHYRGTTFAPRGYRPIGFVNNVFGGEFKARTFDGVKMDIEGSEGPLLDYWLLPACRKLVMEYHTSRDPCVPNLRARLFILKKHFTNVRYPPEFDRVLASGVAQHKSHFDRMIFAWR